MKKSLLRELGSNLEYMSSVERRIAEYILANAKDVISCSLGRFAQAVGVSQGSVSNFSVKYTGGGFPTLKLEIASCLSAEAVPFAPKRASDTLKAMLDGVSADALCAFTNTVALNTEEVLVRVAEMIRRAKKVEIYGVYRSAVVATDFYYQLLQLGIGATFVSDVLTCAVSASMLTEGSLVIAVSASGQTQDVINAVKLARANGVDVVAITAHKSSPLANLASEVLICAPSGSSISQRANEIRLSQLLICDALCSYLRSKTDADGSHRYFEMMEILSSHNVKE